MLFTVSSHIFCTSLLGFFQILNFDFACFMWRRAGYLIAVLIFLTHNANVCCNSRAGTNKCKKKQYFSIALISLTILQIFLVSWCSWTLCKVCAIIASLSIFPTDLCLLKPWICCANYPKSHKQNVLHLHNFLRIWVALFKYCISTSHVSWERKVESAESAMRRLTQGKTYIHFSC